MCGITGIVATDALESEDRARVLRMRDVLTHRGPDDCGVYVDQRAALGHRRLSIVDLATGAQPLTNEDQSVWIVYNGEIYNHLEVRHDLEQRSHRFRTQSDTEAIVHAYEEWSDACVDKLRGMFAFAIWDTRDRRLLLARDRLGIKPLYWTRQAHRLLFGSEIKALVASGLVTAAANEARLPELLSTRYLSGEETLFTGVFKLLPGHVLIFENGQVCIRQFWDIPHSVARGAARPAHHPEQRPGATEKQDSRVVREFKELLTESVRLRLMSDVPLGMFLSGGLDSSAIAVVMARLMDRPLQTFSVAFDEQAFSELEYSRLLVRAIGAANHEVIVTDHEYFDALPRLIWHEDEPIAHPSSVPLYFVSKLAADHVKVVLTGEGSDELLGGYGKYVRTLANLGAATVYRKLLPTPVRTAVAQAVTALPRRFRRRLMRSFLALPPSPEALALDAFAAVPLAKQQVLLSGDLRTMATSRNAYAPTMKYFDAVDGNVSVLERLLYTDMKTYLVELLMKQDQMSMAASIESRVPFLDHRLVEFAAALPSSWKVQRLTTKRILREAFKGDVPNAILSRRKMGFPVPVGKWFAGKWNAVARDVLLDSRTLQRGIFSARGLTQLLTDHAQGREAGTDAIWSCLNLELWYRTFIDGDGVQQLPLPAGGRLTVDASHQAHARLAS